MATQTGDLGTFEPHGDHIDVRFERIYPRPPETVWKALTDPARLADWMGVCKVEPHVGGRFETMLDGPHPSSGTVSVWDPPNTLEFSWTNTHAPASTIRYELTAHEGGTRLVFTHRHMPYATSALMLPGWHMFLARLGKHVADDGAQPPAWQQLWRQLQAIYVEHYSLTGVQLDP